MQLPRYAIFDLDGTLLDSMGMWVDIDFTVLSGHGKSAKPNLAEALAPMSYKESAEYFINEYGVDASVEELINEFDTLAYKRYATDLYLKRGAREFLDYLDVNEVKYALATATDRKPVMAALNRLGIADRFSAIVTCGEVGKSKTEPAVYFEALRMMDENASISDAWIFEDAFLAVETAKKAGFYVVGVDEPTNGVVLTEKIKGMVDRYIYDYYDMEGLK